MNEFVRHLDVYDRIRIMLKKE